MKVLHFTTESFQHSSYLNNVYALLLFLVGADGNSSHWCRLRDRQSWRCRRNGRH